MQGSVNLSYYDKEKFLHGFEENNMIVDGAGQTICDFLTISPSLSAIASASSLLDASNYTIQAISFGKDAEGYRSHAHGLYFQLILPPTPVGVKVASYKPVDLSSYHSSATPYYFSSAAFANTSYSPFPKYPDPTDTRLEMRTTATIPGFTGALGIDLGQNGNSLLAYDAFLPEVLGAGCYAPGVGMSWMILSDPTNVTSIIVSGIYYGLFNIKGSMDLSGNCHMMSSSVIQGMQFGGSAVSNSSGLSLYALPSFSSTGRVGYHVTLSGGDAGMACLFGGIYHMGLWVLDIPKLLELGLTPPYGFNRFANSRLYRLFAKKTFNKDITYIQDDLGVFPISSGALAYQELAININWELVF